MYSITDKGSCTTFYGSRYLIGKTNLSHVWEVAEDVRKDENKEIKELLEQYEDSEIRDSEMQAERKENQFEPSKEFEEAMAKLFEDVPKYQKRFRRKRLRKSVAFVCTIAAKAALLVVLLVVFASEVSGNGMLVASVNQIMLASRKEDAVGMVFFINNPKDSDELKSVSKLVIDFQYIPAGYQLISDEVSTKFESRIFRYAKDAENKFLVCISSGVVTEQSAFNVGSQNYSVFQAGAIEVTKIKIDAGVIFYVWMQYDYLFVLSSTEDLQGEVEQLIASIQIS